MHKDTHVHNLVRATHMHDQFSSSYLCDDVFSMNVPALWTLWICLNIVLYQSLGLSTVCTERNNRKGLCTKDAVLWTEENKLSAFFRCL